MSVDPDLINLLIRDSDRYAYRQFGRCTRCDQIEREDGRMLYLYGRTAEKLMCPDCHIQVAEADAEKAARARARVPRRRRKKEGKT